MTTAWLVWLVCNCVAAILALQYWWLRAAYFIGHDHGMSDLALALYNENVIVSLDQVVKWIALEKEKR